MDGMVSVVVRWRFVGRMARLVSARSALAWVSGVAVFAGDAVATTAVGGILTVSE